MPRGSCRTETTSEDAMIGDASIDVSKEDECLSGLAGRDTNRDDDERIG